MAIFSKGALEKIERDDQYVRKRLILIVDDEEHNLTALKYTLADKYDVLTASDGRDALNFLETDQDPTRIHMIISDQRMPIMTGVEFLRHSINIIPRTIRIILTGFTDVEAIMDSINQARIYKYILKPFDDNDILLSIKRGLELYDLEENNRKLVDTLEFFNGKFFSHMRDILQNIHGSTELLEKATIETLTQDQINLLDQTRASTSNLITLLMRASELSYVYTGDRPMQKEQLDILSLIHDVADHFCGSKSAGDVTVKYEWMNSTVIPKEGLTYYLEADCELVSKALKEVLENGFTYAEKPTTLTIGTDIHGNFLYIRVTDEGIGLENEGGAALLAPFARGMRCEGYQPFGFGIGLANAKAFIEAHNGELYFTQNLKGSTVVLTLPIPDYEQGLLLPVDKLPRRIAIYQEDLEELNLHKEILEFEGYEVSAYETPDALVDSTAVSPPDLIILDAHYHGESTDSIIKNISYPDLDFPPTILVLVDESDPETLQSYLDSGAHSCLTKPVDYAELTNLLQDL